MFVRIQLKLKQSALSVKIPNLINVKRVKKLGQRGKQLDRPTQPPQCFVNNGKLAD